jgi:hypothetical protein
MDAGFLSRGLILIIGRGALLRFGGVMDSIIIFSAMGGDAMRLTERIKKRRADFWAALGDDGNNGIEELLKLYWWWGSDTADFFFDKFVPAGLRLENLEVEKKNAIGTMQTAVRDDVTQLPRLLRAQRRDMDRLAVSVADAAFEARLAERRDSAVLAGEAGPDGSARTASALAGRSR